MNRALAGMAKVEALRRTGDSSRFCYIFHEWQHAMGAGPAWFPGEEET